MEQDTKLVEIILDRLKDALPAALLPVLTGRHNVLYVSTKVDGKPVARMTFDYPSSISDAEYIASKIISYTKKDSFAGVAPIQKSQVAEKADVDVQALRSELETLKETLAKQPTAIHNNEQLAQVQVSLTAMEARVTSLTETIPELTVPIYIPPREEMAPRLISSHAFTRLEEARSDEQWAIAVMFLTLGSIVGMLINYATVESATGFVITRAGQIALGLFAFAFVASIVWLVRIHKRVNEAKEKVLTSSTEVLKRRAGRIGVDKSDTGG